MQKKGVFLVCAITVLMSFKALSQSSHDATGGPDADLAEAGSGTFEIYSPDRKFKFGFRGHLQQNNKIAMTKAGEGNKWTPRFDMELKRARISFYGSAFDPRITYLFQAGFEQRDADPTIRQEKGVHTAPGTDFLRDYYVNLAWHDLLHFRIGKFRSPFSRQQLMSTTQMQLYDQRLTTDEFQVTSTGRDVGIMVHNGFDNFFEYAFAAISNGIVARAGYNYKGIDAYEMVDFTGGPLRFAVAANGFLHTDYKTAKLSDVRTGADFIAKIHGFSTNGAVFYGYKKLDEAEALNNFGAGADFGYLIQKRYEPVARYSWIKVGEVHRHEILGGFNYYIFGHHLKSQLYAAANLVGDDIVRWLGGVQFQFAI